MLKAYLQGLLYIGRVCARPTVGLAAQLAAKLTVGYIASTIEVIDRAGVLQAILIILIV